VLQRTRAMTRLSNRVIRGVPPLCFRDLVKVSHAIVAGFERDLRFREQKHIHAGAKETLGEMSQAGEKNYEKADYLNNAHRPHTHMVCALAGSARDL
jgi:hypothetical protein